MSRVVIHAFHIVYECLKAEYHHCSYQYRAFLPSSVLKPPFISLSSSLNTCLPVFYGNGMAICGEFKDRSPSHCPTATVHQGSGQGHSRELWRASLHGSGWEGWVHCLPKATHTPGGLKLLLQSSPGGWEQMDRRRNYRTPRTLPFQCRHTEAGCPLPLHPPSPSYCPVWSFLLSLEQLKGLILSGQTCLPSPALFLRKQLGLPEPQLSYP